MGLALSRSFSGVRRLGYSHRAVTRRRALEAAVVDEVFDSVGEAVKEAQLVILASPIGTFEQIMCEMAGELGQDCVVTDVGSTKVLPVRWAGKIFGKKVHFLGSHPMAGSEQRGVEFARADLFDDAYCILTPTAVTKPAVLRLLRHFWQALGMRVSSMSPTQHDKVLARISHLPHVLAAALVICSDDQEMLLCGKGFLDTTRIASGPSSVWRDILLANADNTAAAIGKLIKELEKVQQNLGKQNEQQLVKMLEKAKEKRDDLVAKKLQRQDLPA